MHTGMTLQTAIKTMSSATLLKWSEEASEIYGEDSFTATEVRYVVATEIGRRADLSKAAQQQHQPQRPNPALGRTGGTA